MLSLDELLTRLQPEKQTSGKIVVVYGPTKIGKTTTFVQSPAPLLIEVKDKSSAALKESRQMDAKVPVLQVTGWLDALEVLASLATGDHQFKSIILDGATGLEEYCNEYLIERDYDGSPEKFFGYGRGEKPAASEWSNLMAALDKLKDRGLMVFLLAHQGIEKVKNAMGDDYIKVVPQLSPAKLSSVVKYADAILFMTSIVAQKDVNSATKIGKAVGGEVRVMHTKPSASYEAGNRMNLSSPIMLGSNHTEAFANFFAAVRAGKATS